MALIKPFAVNGNKQNIPLNKTDDGSLNYEEGFGARYEQPIKAVIDEKGNITSTGGLQITRPQFNGLINELSRAIIENQDKSARNFQLINDLANVVSGAAFFAKDNTFSGENTFKGVSNFSGAANFEDAKFKTLQVENKATFSSASFKGSADFLSSATFSSASFAINPDIENPLPYSAMANDSLITKADLEKQVEYLKGVISAIAANISVNGGNASFDTLRVKRLIVSGGATILSGATTSGSASILSGGANSATATIFTDSGLHLVKFNNENQN